MRRPAAISPARSPALVLAASALLALAPAGPAAASFMPDEPAQVTPSPPSPPSPSAPGPAPLGPAVPESPAPPFGEAFTVTADRIEYNSLARTLAADGHVRASSGETVITADHLEGSVDTQEVTATGHVTLSQGLTTATGTLLTYNLGTKVGRMENLAGTFGPLHVSGQAIEIGPKQDVVSEASVTPCDPDHPFYKITAKKIVIVPDESFTAYDASLWVGGVRVITLPTYTATLRGRSGPSLGFNTLDGLYIEYANSFPVGDWRDEYRIRLATTTGLSAENILSERAADHLWAVDLGRSLVQDVNGNLFNIDRYSLDLTYDRARLPWVPIDFQFEAHGGSYRELATGVAATRAEGIATFATDAFRLGPRLFTSASGRVRYDTYGSGQQRTEIEGSAALTSPLSLWASASLSYSGVAVSGSTPFLFDLINPSSVVSFSYTYIFGGFLQSANANLSYDFLAQQTTLGLNVSMTITPTTAFSVSSQYNLSSHLLTEVDYAVNVRCDCVTVGFVYRTFPQSPSANTLVLTVELNSLGNNVTF